MISDDQKAESDRLALLYLGKTCDQCSKDEFEVLLGLINLDVEVSAAYNAYLEGVVDAGGAAWTS